MASKSIHGAVNGETGLGGRQVGAGTTAEPVAELVADADLTITSST